jgi:hypothetical protein
MSPRNTLSLLATYFQISDAVQQFGKHIPNHDDFVDAVFVMRIEMLGDRATKNFRGHICTRDQKHNLGIGVIGWGLQERRRRTGGFCNDMLTRLVPLI